MKRFKAEGMKVSRGWGRHKKFRPSPTLLDFCLVVFSNIRWSIRFNKGIDLP